MKHLFIIFLFLELVFGCRTNEPSVRLLTEQKLLKDSANRINEKIGLFIRNGSIDSVEMAKRQIVVVHERLTAIQKEIDSRTKNK